MVQGDGGLGESLVGEKIMINHRHVSVAKLLGEGTFVMMSCCHVCTSMW
jgi:hypothetical protein